MSCKNKNGLYNLQPAGCIVTPGIVQMFIFVPYYKADGSINGIDLTSSLNEVAIDALINQTDKNLRWYVTDKVSNFVTERADPNTESIDGVEYIISEGVRTMSGDFLSSSAVLAKELNNNSASEMGVYLVDKANGLTGIIEDKVNLNPIKLERNSFGKIVFATESNVFKVSYSSTWSRLVTDGDVRTLTYDEHQTNLLDKKGLIDVESKEVVVTTTTVDVDIFIENGDAKGIPFTGLLLADFTMTNLTTSLAVVPSAVVEVSDGHYEFTFTAQTALDLGQIDAVKAGFEFAPINFTFA